MKRLIIGCILYPYLFVAQLNKFVSEWANDKDLNNGIQSFCVYDHKNDLVLAEHNAHIFMIPASTMKAITTAAALKTLGNNYRFATKIAYTGTFNKETGIVNGDILIIGSGDPTIQSESFYKADSSGLMDKWAQTLVALGIKQIKGNIIGDASAWEHLVPGHWIWADIGNYFGAVPCALSFMDNKFKVIFNSKSAGSEAEVVKLIPTSLTPKMNIVNKVIAKGTEDEAFVYGDPFGYTKYISGRIPPNKKNFEVEAALPDPALLCAESLLTSLKHKGVVCAGTYTSNYEKKDTSYKSTTLHTHYSPTLERIVQVTNVTSNNLFAETILRAMAYGSPSNGIEQVKKFLTSKSIDTNELYMVDGSGLSRADLVTTALQAKMLGKIMSDPSISKTFYNSLPIAGKQGSMSHIGNGTYIEGKMRAKTGYINRSRAYCGYITTKTGKELSFSIIFNNYNCSAKEAKIKIEKFLVALGDE